MEKTRFNTKTENKILNEIQIAIREIENGEGIPMEEVVAEMEAKYNINGRV